MKNFLKTLRDRRRTETGATMVIVAIAMSVLIPSAGAMSVDLGIIAATNRSLQGVADAAAMSGAQNLSTATTAAQNAATDNGVGGAVASSDVVEGDTYSGSSVSGTCTTSSLSCYVQVTARKTMHDLFVFGTNSLSRTAVAQVTPSNADFAIGTYLANFDSTQSAALNSLLSVLGTSVNLTAVGYDGLATSNVTVQQLLTASNTVLSPSNTLNASDVLSTRVTDAQWVAIINKAYTGLSGLPPACPGTDPCTPSLLSWVTGLAPTSSLPVQGACTSITNPCLSQLLSINGSTSTSGTLTVGELQASANVLQMLTMVAQTANGSNGINISSELNLGLLGVATLSVKVIQPPQSAAGGVGTSATTSQVQIALTILGVPITISAVQGTATFSSLSCSGYPTPTPSSASFNITDTIAGAVGITVTGNPNNSPLAINAPYPNSGTTAAGSISLLGLSVLGALLTPVTQAVLEILEAFGVSIAGNKVWVFNAQCGYVSLVK
ncbi:MAG TPA: hypothetical protein VNG12_26805 [Acidimicrobiales bacterium]|nr:hypothetical protein [Acidimicrobiales bacterium]